jgi:hypothetical protein
VEAKRREERVLKLSVFQKKSICKVVSDGVVAKKIGDIKKK